MAQLVDGLHAWSYTTAFPLDRAVGDQSRDAAMAAAIVAELSRSTQATVVALLGNAHAATSPSGGETGSRPTGACLRAVGVDVISVLGIPTRGTYWAITGPHGLGGVHELRERMDMQDLAACYDFAMEIGPVTAALPWPTLACGNV